MKLRLRDLLKAVMGDEICLYYHAGDDKFEDLYEGSSMVEIPDDLLDAEVQVVSAKKKNVLDIQLNAEDIPVERKSS